MALGTATVLFLALSLHSSCSNAQWVVTNPISDLLAGISAVNAYAQQGLQYEEEILQYEAMIKNLEQNPIGGIAPNFTLLATNASRIVSEGQSIAQNMGQVSTNIRNTFKTPQPNFGMQFGLWTQSSQNAITAAMLNAGLHRENFASDTAALQALVVKNQASGGNLAALQTLGEFMAAQLQESMKLRDLISSQQLATNTALMQQTAMAQAKEANSNSVNGTVLAPLPAKGQPLGGL